MIIHEPGMPPSSLERPAFIDQAGAQLYVMHHQPDQAPKGVVVLAGPMSAERSNAYLSWVRWARTLAHNGFACYRFDYRGIGESSGDFVEQSFTSWADDLQAVVDLARRHHQAAPILVNGLRLGALLAQSPSGVSGLLAWDPPASGSAMLADILRRKLAADCLGHLGGRKTREAYEGEIRAGGRVDVEGYPWTDRLWRSAEGFAFGPTLPFRALYLDGRPAERLPDGERSESVRIPRPPFWLSSSVLVPDLTELFKRSIGLLGDWR